MNGVGKRGGGTAEHHHVGASSFLTQITICEEILSLPSRAFLVGWNIDSFRCCVVGAFELPSTDFGRLQSALKCTAQALPSIYATCSPNGQAQPVVLGEWVPPGHAAAAAAATSSASSSSSSSSSGDGDIAPLSEFQGQSIWITVSCDPPAAGSSSGAPRLPKLLSVYSLGSLYSTSCYMVVYRPVNTDRLHTVSVAGSVRSGSRSGIATSATAAAAATGATATATAMAGAASRWSGSPSRPSSSSKVGDGSFSPIRTGDFGPPGGIRAVSAVAGAYGSGGDEYGPHSERLAHRGGGYGNTHGGITGHDRHDEHHGRWPRDDATGRYGPHASSAATSSLSSAAAAAAAAVPAAATDLEYIVAQINAGHDLLQTTEALLAKDGLGGARRRPPASVLDLWWAVWLDLLPSVVDYPLSAGAWVWYVWVAGARRALDWRGAAVPASAGWLGPLALLLVPFGPRTQGARSIRRRGASGTDRAPYGTATADPTRGGGVAGLAGGAAGNDGAGAWVDTSLADLSCVLACLCQRYAAMEDALLKCAGFAKAWTQPAADRQRLWLEVMSLVCAVAVDVGLGIAAGAVLLRHADGIAAEAGNVCLWLQVDVLKQAIEGLKHAPYGIKLNPLITHKVGYVLKFVIREVTEGAAMTAPLHATVVRIVGCAGAAGLTAQLTLVIDLLGLLTAHVALIHKISAVLHRSQLQLIASLGHLFRGQKNNVLRRRLDTCEYDRHQLLFGTVVFAIAFFLFPSFAAYFYVFAAAQLVVVLLQLALWSAVVGVRDFPYYALVMCLWDPQSVTEGLMFTFTSVLAGQHANQQQQQQQQRQQHSPSQSQSQQQPQGRATRGAAERRDEEANDCPSAPPVQLQMQVLLETSPLRPGQGHEHGQRRGTAGTVAAQSPFAGAVQRVRGLFGRAAPAAAAAAYVTAADDDDVDDEAGRGGAAALHLPSGHAPRANKPGGGLAALAAPSPPLSPPQLRPGHPTRSTPRNAFFPHLGPEPRARPAHAHTHTHTHTHTHGPGPTGPHAATAIHLHLAARPLTLWKLFAGYGAYARRLAAPGGVLWSLLRGFAYGAPSLDTQRVHAMLAAEGGHGAPGAAARGNSTGKGKGMEFSSGVGAGGVGATAAGSANGSGVGSGSGGGGARVTIPFRDLLRTVAASCQPHKTSLAACAEPPRRVGRAAETLLGEAATAASSDGCSVSTASSWRSAGAGVGGGVGAGAGVGGAEEDNDDSGGGAPVPAPAPAPAHAPAAREVVLEEPLVKRRLNRALLLAVLFMYAGSLLCAAAGAAVFAAALTAEDGRGSPVTRLRALGHALWLALTPPAGPSGSVPYLSMLQLPPADGAGNFSAGARNNSTSR